MSKRRSAAASPPAAGPPALPNSRAKPRGLGRLGTLVLIALPLVLAALLLRPRGNAPGPAPGSGASSYQGLLDSLKVADARRDWVTTLRLTERMGELRPRAHAVLLARGTAWSNYAIDQRPGRLHPRPALRTSLERMECLRHALALMDSSAMVAPDSSRWLDSGDHLAQLNETIGLPGDALIAYELIKQRLPNAIAPALRAYWLRALCYDPVHPDTSEWHQRRVADERARAQRAGRRQEAEPPHR